MSGPNRKLTWSNYLYNRWTETDILSGNPDKFYFIEYVEKKEIYVCLLNFLSLAIIWVANFGNSDGDYFLGLGIEIIHLLSLCIFVSITQIKD